LGEFDLKLTFLCSSSGRENVENQSCAVDNFCLDRLLNIFCLAGCEFVIENDDIHALLQTGFAQFLDFSFADVGGGIGSLTSLHNFADDARAGCHSQLA
jgi:hypothetical protein